MTPSSLFNLVPLVVFLPVVGLLVNLLLGRKLGETFSGLVGSLATGLAFVVSLLLAVALAGSPEAVVVPFAEWIKIGTLQVDWAFRVDTLSV
jgi:NADH-quinone oxidoreductase subunit L